MPPFAQIAPYKKGLFVLASRGRALREDFYIFVYSAHFFARNSADCTKDFFPKTVDIYLALCYTIDKIKSN